MRSCVRAEDCLRPLLCGPRARETAGEVTVGTEEELREEGSVETLVHRNVSVSA